MPSRAASTWKTLTSTHQRSLFALIIYLLFHHPTPDKPPQGHKPPFGWYCLVLCLRKSRFTVPPPSPTHFCWANAANCVTVSGCILFSYEWIGQHQTHSRKLIASDDICLCNNWLKSTCCGCGTTELSQSHRSCMSVVKLLLVDFKAVLWKWPEL